MMLSRFTSHPFRIATTALATATIASFGVLLAPTANAATYHVNLSEVCKQQYNRQGVKVRHVDDVNANPAVTTPGGPGADQVHNSKRKTPFGYYCVESVYSKHLGTDGLSGEVTESELGGLDVQAYCTRNHPGTKARGNYDGDKTWDCVS
ncbi:hypothetical protein [Nocardia sp. NPDC049149]|uniref:hypothetical protein n=1 Tax=Nocardia sp. NPDC049149 TaxID=3364315 RepID=UPI00371CE919